MSAPEDLKGRVLSAAGSVAYQAGAVVSRTLIQRPTGTVTLFAFDQGQGLSEHTAPFDALVMVLEGAADIDVAGKMHKVAAGEMIILPQGQVHSLQAVSPFKMALVMIRG
ncbi:MAG: cupin domain-containing protein [Elusimicrobiota bacterium]|jgi:quercetin dioxygenase-like cupin family protein